MKWLFSKIILFFVRLFTWSKSRSGKLTVVMNGKRKITVLTDFTPKTVWLSLSKSPNDELIDSFDIKIVPEGFILLVHLQNEHRELEWMAVSR